MVPLTQPTIVHYQTYVLFIQERGKDGRPQHAEYAAEAARRHPAKHPQGQAEEAASAQRKIENLSTVHSVRENETDSILSSSLLHQVPRKVPGMSESADAQKPTINAHAKVGPDQKAPQLRVPGGTKEAMNEEPQLRLSVPSLRMGNVQVSNQCLTCTESRNKACVIRGRYKGELGRNIFKT